MGNNNSLTEILVKRDVDGDGKITRHDFPIDLNGDSRITDCDDNAFKTSSPTERQYFDDRERNRDALFGKVKHQCRLRGHSHVDHLDRLSWISFRRQG